MNFWTTFWYALQDPFRYPMDSTERIFVGYLASALFLAVLVFFYLRHRQPASTPKNIIAYLFPKRIYLHKSAIADYKFFLVDRIVYFMTFPVTLLTLQSIVTTTQAGLTEIFGPIQEPWDGDSWLVIAASTLLQISAVDFVLFCAHYLQHKVPILWEFHKVHHSAEVMMPLTAYRMHPLETIFNINLAALVSGMLFGVFGYATAGSQPEFLVYGLNAAQFVFYVAGFNLRHSHVPLSFGPLNKVFVSPWMHQVHHGTDDRHLDKNMGFIFSVWDRAFGTLYIPKSAEAVTCGLTNGEHVHFHSLTALYFRPIVNLFKRETSADKLTT